MELRLSLDCLPLLSGAGRQESPSCQQFELFVMIDDLTLYAYEHAYGLKTS